jgi:hypothetical protein
VTGSCATHADAEAGVSFGKGGLVVFSIRGCFVVEFTQMNWSVCWEKSRSRRDEGKGTREAEYY